MPASYSNQPLATIDIGALKSSRFLLERPGRRPALPYRDAEGCVNAHLCMASEKELARLLLQKEDVPQAVQDRLRVWVKHAQAWHKSSGPSWVREEHARGAEWVSSTGQRLKEVSVPGLEAGAEEAVAAPLQQAAVRAQQAAQQAQQAAAQQQAESKKKLERLLLQKKKPQAVKLRTWAKHAHAWHKSSGPSWAQEDAVAAPLQREGTDASSRVANSRPAPDAAAQPAAIAAATLPTIRGIPVHVAYREGLPAQPTSQPTAHHDDVITDEKQAVTLCQKAAAEGDPLAQSRLGFSYEHGLGGLPKDGLQAVEWYRKAAAAENSWGVAHCNLGFMFWTGCAGLIKDEAKAVEQWQKMERCGPAGLRKPTPDTCFGLADPYSLSQGEISVGGGLKAPIFALRESWRAVRVQAARYLGRMHAKEDRGLTEDEEKAGSLWMKAAQGDADAQKTLAVMHEQNLGGLPKNDLLAFHLYQEAAAQGEPEARFNFGRFLIEHPIRVRGGREAAAVRLWQKAAAQGSAAAQCSLGRLYAHGRGGLTKDVAKATELLTAAANSDQDDVKQTARVELDRLNPRLMVATPSDVTAQSDLGRESDLDDFDAMDVEVVDLDLTRAGLAVLKLEYPQKSQLREWFQLRRHHGVIELQCDEEQAKRQRAEQHSLQQRQKVQRLSHQLHAHPPPAPQAPLPPAPYLQRKPRSRPWPGPGPRPLFRVDYLNHATRWESLPEMRNSTEPRLKPQRCDARTLNYDGPLSVITAESSGPSDNDLEVIFFHTQDWSWNGTPYPQAYTGEKAKYVPVLAITVDNALGDEYDYGVFLLSDVHQVRGSTDKRLLKILLAARGSDRYCQARIFDELAKHGHDDPDTGERVASTIHLGDVGPGHKGNVATLDDGGDVLFTLTYKEDGWEMMVPDQRDKKGQYCALDIALALPSSRPCLPLHRCDGGGELPDGVPPDGVFPRGARKKHTEPGRTRVWPKKPENGENGGIQLAPRGHSTR